MLLYKNRIIFHLFDHIKNKVGVELGLSNYATNSNLKTATGARISQFPKKDDLANLELGVNQLDIDKLASTKWFKQFKR